MSSKLALDVATRRNVTPGRKTIAAFFDYMNPFSGGYQAEIRRALNEHCCAHEANLLVVFGRAIEEPNPQSAAYNAIYDLIDPDQVDGLIILSTTLVAHCGVDGITRFLQRFWRMPLCSLGIAVPNAPSVTVDNRRGMDSVMEHMIAHHGCRRIAFIAGTESSPEAQARLQVYRAALDRHAIAFDPALVVNGSFQWTRGVNAMEELLSRQIEIDAVVAANDLMALGAIEALRKRGYRIPGDLPVTGFDDLPISSIENPPLTTVAQPYAAMAQQALEVVLDQIAGRTVPELKELPAGLVIRRSCGCGSRTRRQRNRAAVDAASDATGQSLHDPKDDRPEQQRTSPEGETAPFADAISLEEPPTQQIELSLLSNLDSLNQRRDDLQQLRALTRAEIQELWGDACERVALANQREQLKHRAAADETLAGMIAIGERISVALDLPSLSQALLEILPSAGVRTAYLSRYADRSFDTLEAFVFMYQGQPLTPANSSFPARQLVPLGAYPPELRHTFTVFPMVFDMEPLGVAVFEYSEESQGYQMVRDQVAAALRSVALHQAVVEQTKLHERSVQEQERLATVKRMQALSVLAGGVAHDLNNVLGPLVALPDVMLQVLDELDRSPQAIRDLRADLQSIKGSSLRAAQTIKDLLTLSRQGRTTKEPVDLGQLVSTCLSGDNLRSIQRVNDRVEIVKEVATDPLVVVASEAHLVRAITNLVRNAAEAIQGTGQVVVRAFSARVTEQIPGFETVEPGNYAVVAVSDNGVGIAEQELARVFEPFVSQKRLGEQSGSGLGLAIVHSVVKEHEGFIDISSAIGRGTTFTLYFPRSEEIVLVQEQPHVMQRGSAKILVVDDDPTQLRTCRRVLTYLGYEVDALVKGQEACALFEQAASANKSPYDLVILDMVLDQGLDGLDVYQRIQRLFPSQRAIMVSGYAAVQRAEAALQRGLRWLAKPYTAEALAQAVHNALSAGSIRRMTTLSSAPPQRP